jgi:hypothetical protein
MGNRDAVEHERLLTAITQLGVERERLLEVFESHRVGAVV